MYEEIHKNLASVVTLMPEEWEAFRERLTFKKLRRREFFLQPHEVCKHVAFVKRGCLRYFYDAAGEERTGQFFFENSWYTDYESFLTGEPSSQAIQALEPTELCLLSKGALYELYERYPTFERFGRLMAENAYLGSRRNNVSLLTASPEERYLDLIQTRPKLLERVALRYIASYLGIQPESLSRIRKRLFNQRQNS